MTQSTLCKGLTIAFAAAFLAFCGIAPAAAGHTPIDPMTLTGPINPPAIEQSIEPSTEHEIDLKAVDMAAEWTDLAQETRLEPTLTGTVEHVSGRSAAIALPLPPAVLTGGAMLAGNFIVAGLFKKRRI